MRRAARWKSWRRLRQISQVAFFALFLYLLFAGAAGRASGGSHPLADVFFRFNPLSALTASLSSRELSRGMGWALLIVLLTLLAGRIWCGWICPLGTLLEWTRFRKAARTARHIPQKLRAAKYVLLVAILAMAFLGSLSLLVLEPLGLITRVFTVAVIPGLNYAVTSIEGALYEISALRPLIDSLESLLRGAVLPARQPVFTSPLPVVLLFAGIIALNRLADRFWCRYLCPLGALLGWLAKFSLFRPSISSTCSGCRRCSLACRLGAIEVRQTSGPTGQTAELNVLATECTMCLDCLASCSNDGMSLLPSLKPAAAHELDLSRRGFLQALAAGVAGMLVLRLDAGLQVKKSSLIRPPGVLNETEFLSSCVRCSECINICPTTALQPAITQARLEGLWTPILIPRIGYCDYGCSACGQVCPTKAIPLLSLEEKRQKVIGRASVDKDRCLVWAYNTPCIVCEEMCPTPQKSIRLEVVSMVGADGEIVELQRPYVLSELCIGCGICENRCPVEGDAAIQVYGGVSIS